MSIILNSVIESVKGTSAHLGAVSGDRCQRQKQNTKPGEMKKKQNIEWESGKDTMQIQKGHRDQGSLQIKVQ